MNRQIDVYLLPALVEPADLAGKAVAVIDVLRATTTTIQALAAGATEVIPCLEIEEARHIAAPLGDQAVTGGERGGKQIPGFDLGNSPAEFTPEHVAGKTVVFTTTNGTRAMQRCKQARRVLIAAFTNLSAVCRELVGEPQVALVCAGTDGHVTREDSLLAGAIVTELSMGATAGLPSSASLGGTAGSSSSARRNTARQAGRATLRLNDQAEIAADAWSTAVRLMTDRPLGMMLRDSRGGRNLIDIGQEHDIDLAAQIDRLDIVPELDLQSWRIRVA